MNSQEIYEGIALPNGSYLEEYLIEKELGAGTFGVTYLATDTNLDKKVVIKEYLPNDIAIRQDSETIMPKSKGDQENFEYGLESFTKEAKVLARFSHPNIVKINRLFQTNNTAYFVMDYDEGEDLQEYIKRHKNFSEEEILSIIMPILDGLRAVHDADFLHRDIKPGNIYIRDNSSPMLIDFGASRMAMGIKSKSLSVVLTEGYAPKEQYSSTSKQGPFTDLYAIGAVMYKMATGITPPEASARADAITDDEPDPFVQLQSRTDLNYSDNFKRAVDWALEFSGKNRPQTVLEFQNMLDSTQIVQPLSTPNPPKKEKKITEQNNSTPSKNKAEKKKNIMVRLFSEFFIISRKKEDNGTATAIYWGIFSYILLTVFANDIFNWNQEGLVLISASFFSILIGVYLIRVRKKRMKGFTVFLFWIIFSFLFFILSSYGTEKIFNINFSDTSDYSKYYKIYMYSSDILFLLIPILSGIVILIKRRKK